MNSLEVLGLAATALWVAAYWKVHPILEERLRRWRAARLIARILNE